MIPQRLGLLSLLLLSILDQNFAIVNNAVSPTLIIVDGFSSYLGGHCKAYCDENGIRIKDVVSPYICDIFNQRGRSVPEYLRAPAEGTEVEWAESQGLIENDLVCAISESESGIDTMERIQVSLNLRGNGKKPQMRNKFLANELVRKAGLPVVKQRLAKSWNEAKEFIAELSSSPDSTNACVLKPCRGVASDGVFLCSSQHEAGAAFNKLFGKARYGGGRNSAVLIQEYAEGPEYAVDTVAKDGEIKVLAVWKCVKKEANGAPFVYQCTELVSAEGETERALCDYSVRALQALDLRWGPAHTEVRLTASGPRLVEVNARWHAQNFVPITRRCLGTDAITATLDAYFKPEGFGALPARPELLSTARGRIVHLISTTEGVISAVRHLDEIRALPSVHLLEVPLAAGDVLVKTVDIRTDAGYVILMHDDDEVLRADYERILELQDTIFEVLPTEASRGERHAMERTPVDICSDEETVAVRSTTESSALVQPPAAAVPTHPAEEEPHRMIGEEGYAPAFPPLAEERAAAHGGCTLYFPTPVRAEPGTRQAAVVSNVVRGIRAVARSVPIRKLSAAFLRVAALCGLEYGLGVLFVVLVPFFADRLV